MRFRKDFTVRSNNEYYLELDEPDKTKTTNFSEQYSQAEITIAEIQVIC